MTLASRPNPDEERCRQELARLGVPWEKTAGLEKDELQRLLDETIDDHNAKVRAGKSDSARARHARLDTTPTYDQEHTTMTPRADLLSRLSPADRERAYGRSDEYIRGLVDHQDAVDGDPEVADLMRHFDEALEFSTLYAAAQPWRVGDVAARNAALTAMKDRSR